MADESELLLKYRESVDKYMDKNAATAKIDEVTARKNEALAKLDKNDPNYEKQVKAIEAKEKKMLFKEMRNMNTGNEKKKRKSLI